jgi:hypothetical protein
MRSSSHPLRIPGSGEETLFYPAARKAAPDTADHVLESIEEHHVVVWTLSELTT